MKQSSSGVRSLFSLLHTAWSEENYVGQKPKQNASEASVCLCAAVLVTIIPQ